MLNKTWNTIYCGPPPEPAQLWSSWNLDPALLLTLATLCWLVRRNPSGLCAAAVLGVAFVSPLCPLSSALFSARVVHHVLLIAVAAPLLARVRPAINPTHPALPLALSAIVLWGWHVPVAYDLALSNVAIYWGMQISLLASAVWFWRAVLSPGRPPIDALSFIILAYAQMGMLGAVLTFAPEPLYAAHAIAPYSWGFTPLDDQQLGGLIMWGPAGIAYAVLGAVVACSWWATLRQAQAG